jgi:hypothetical protein
MPLNNPVRFIGGASIAKICNAEGRDLGLKIRGRELIEVPLIHYHSE